MFSEVKEHDRRLNDRQKDVDHHSFIRHRIPYRLLGRRSLGAKRLVVSSKVLFPAIPTQNCDVVLTFPANTEDSTLMWLLARLKSRTPALTVHVRHHSHTGIYGFYLTASYESLLQGAEEGGILKPLKSEYGGGMKEFVYEDQDCFAGVEDAGAFLTSQERQNIVVHFLHELRATGDDTLEGITFIEGQPIVPLLITKKVISQVFPLHNYTDLKRLQQTWVQAIFSSQPLDDVCSYFGVKIGLYFAYLGHYTTWLILPALVGLAVFMLQGWSQWHEDLCYLGFALFNTMWTTVYLKFWNRRSKDFCYRWGTLEQKDDMLKDPRPLFKGDLVKSPVTGHLELVYPSWKRLLFRYFITFPVITICLAFVFIVMLLCFELQEWVNELISEEELPYVFSFVPKVLLAVVVSICDEIYKQIAIWLTHKENYRLQESYETSLVVKLVLFQFVNSFLSLFYIGFYLHDLDRLRDQLAALLITRQVLGNLKEALLPLVIWKARLYSVGLRIVTRMSPASVEKEVRRMTTHSPADATGFPAKTRRLSSEGRKNSDSEGSPATEEDDERLPALTQAEVESAMKTYEDTLDDYLEMCIQFGYITLFSPAFPLAAVCALLNNVIEIRSDAFKLCFTFQRPFGQRVASIGIWQDVLLVLSVVAVIVNCALIFTSGLIERVCPGLTSNAYCLIIIIIEHVIITSKFGLYRSIPDLPPTVATEMARLEYQRSEALKQLVSQMNATAGGGGSLSHFPGSPILRRRRVDNSSSEPSVRESLFMHNPSQSGGGKSGSPSSSPTIITPTSILQRPSDIYLGECHSKPATPPVTSIQKPSAGPSQVFPYSDVADKVVAAAMNPLFESQSSKIPCATSTTQTAATSTPVLSLKSHENQVENKTKLKESASKRSLHSKLDFESLRRRSEPVTSEVTQAINQFLSEKGERGLRDKGAAGSQDLHESLQQELRKSKERLSLRQEMIRSRDRSALVGNLGEGLGKAKEELAARSLSAPRSSNLVTSLPPTTTSSSSRLAAPVSRHSPRILQRLLGDTKALSKKSRSLSTTDISHIKQSFRNRFSWRGDSSLTGLTPSRVDPGKISPDVAESLEHADSSMEPGRSIDVIADSHSEEEKSECAIVATDPNNQTVLQPLPSLGSDVKELQKSDGQPKKSPLNRAVRGSASKPLSVLSTAVDPHSS